MLVGMFLLCIKGSLCFSKVSSFVFRCCFLCGEVLIRSNGKKRRKTVCFGCNAQCPNTQVANDALALYWSMSYGIMIYVFRVRDKQRRGIHRS